MLLYGGVTLLAGLGTFCRIAGLALATQDLTSDRLQARSLSGTNARSVGPV